MKKILIVFTVMAVITLVAGDLLAQGQGRGQGNGMGFGKGQGQQQNNQTDKTPRQKKLQSKKNLTDAEFMTELRKRLQDPDFRTRLMRVLNASNNQATQNNGRFAQGNRGNRQAQGRFNQGNRGNRQGQGRFNQGNRGNRQGQGRGMQNQNCPMHGQGKMMNGRRGNGQNQRGNMQRQNCPMQGQGRFTQGQRGMVQRWQMLPGVQGQTVKRLEMKIVPGTGNQRGMQHFRVVPQQNGAKQFRVIPQQKGLQMPNLDQAQIDRLKQLGTRLMMMNPEDRAKAIEKLMQDPKMKELLGQFRGMKLGQPQRTQKRYELYPNKQVEPKREVKPQTQPFNLRTLDPETRKKLQEYSRKFAKYYEGYKDLSPEERMKLIEKLKANPESVSYTHLTLPTN